MKVYKLSFIFKSQHLSNWLCSVHKMISISILILASFFTCIKSHHFTNPHFVADIATHFNRLGIIHHLPPMERSRVLRYYKTIRNFRYFEIQYLLWKVWRLWSLAARYDSSKHLFSPLDLLHLKSLLNIGALNISISIIWH